MDANQKKYKENATITGRVREYKNNAYMFIWEARWTPQWRTAFHYVKATAGECSRVNAVCNTNGLDGSQMSFGFAYNFSRRTYLFVMASMVRNDFSAVYNNSNLQGPNPGEDVKQLGVGIHTAW